MNVPFANLKRQHDVFKKQLVELFERHIDESNFVRGQEIIEFENEFSEAHSLSHVVSCANGTDAISIAAMALGIRPGDKVLVPAMTWVSSASAISILGAIPIFCDIDPETWNINLETISDDILEDARGIIVVHLYGNPADMKRICNFASHHKLWIIEDCAQSHFSKVNNKYVGTYGDAATFSFYPGKNLGALGDAGCVSFKRESDAIYARRYANHGSLKKGEHAIIGLNSRLDSIQASILRLKLRKLDEYTLLRQGIAQSYIDSFSDMDQVKMQKVSKYSEHVYHLFTISVDNRNALKRYLSSHNIETNINYPRSLNKLPCYEHIQSKAPVAEWLADTCISLPIDPLMKQDEVNTVIEAVRDYFR